MFHEAVRKVVRELIKEGLAPYAPAHLQGLLNDVHKLTPKIILAVNKLNLNREEEF